MSDPGIFAAAVVFLFGLLSPAEASDFFDGSSLSNWTTQDGKPVTRGWIVEDGVIHLDLSEGKAGHIITNRDYENFVLDFEFKVAKGGNSGIKYRVRDYDGKLLGCEYQVFDDAQNDKLPEDRMTASLYEVYEPSSSRVLNPAGEWNSGRIVVNGRHIEHWLNGQLVVSAEVGSPEWFANVEDSKFNQQKVEAFGQTPFGRIMLTDHNSEVWFRNFNMRETPPESGGFVGLPTLADATQIPVVEPFVVGSASPTVRTVSCCPPPQCCAPPSKSFSFGVFPSN